MKFISPTTHGVLDYLTIIFLMISPSVFNMQGDLKDFTYVLAIVHLLLTLATSYPLGLAKLISFRIHGYIELAVAAFLVAVAIYFNAHSNTFGLYYYMILALIIVLVFSFTDFNYAKDVRVRR